MNDVYVGDEKLISTTRASELSGYSQDYVGQLCREEKIDCRRISGHWYVDEQSLTKYQKEPQTAEMSQEAQSEKKAYGIKVGNVRDDTFTYDGIEYIATSRAAEITGYAQDYIGQLARNGEVEARKVGRRWFVGRASLVEHKKKSDAMLAAVQAEAAGLGAKEANNEGAEIVESEETEIEIHKNAEPGDIHFNVRYVSESDKELIPRVPERVVNKSEYAPRDIPQESPQATRNSFSQREPVLSREKTAQNPNETESRMVRKAIVRENREAAFQPTKREKRTARSFTFFTALVAGILIVVAISYYVYRYGVSLSWFSSILEQVSSFESMQSFQEAFGDFLPGKEVEYSSE